MKTLNIEATETSPKIFFDINNGIFDIIGKSRPENVRDFYVPIINWLDNYEKDILQLYLSNKNYKLLVNLIFEYFNSSSAKFIYEIVSKFHKIQNKGIIVEVKWFYDEGDDDILEAGKELSKIIDFPFHFVSIKEHEQD
jgi:hypothetical protein